mgnify:CR=1 FL=1|tara:strand:+ start:4366 stop:4635 length:270 start_codon:yes stop_codon:yes gene_type:complete
MFKKVFKDKILKTVVSEKGSILKLLMKDLPLTDIIKYVKEENDADLRINDLELEVAKLKRDSHPPMFTESDRDEIIKRITRIENYLKRR